MTINKKDVQYIASLSRIHLRDDEVEGLTQNLEKILDYVAKLEKLNTADVKPTSHVLPLINVFREDQPGESLEQKDILNFSVEHHNGSFKVPKVIE